jgi:hypothetical protein
VFGHNRFLSEILSRHSIPVKFGKLERGNIAETITHNGTSLIIIDKEQSKGVTQEYATTMILHEIIHAITVDALNNPQTSEEIKFKRDIQKMLDSAQSLFSKSRKLDVDDLAYALSNEKEFAAMFVTDESIRQELLQMMNQNNRMSGKIKSFINSLSRLLVNKNVFKTNE